jgi:hypothetical protein
MKKRSKLLGLFIVLGFFLIGIISATYCCERTTNGAWCQNVNNASSCNPLFGKTSAFCEATSYCKLGTCINTREGICLSSPKGPCVGNNGTWIDNKMSEVPQCTNGCCFIGGGASFTTSTRCNLLSKRAGVVVNYQSAINDEQTCLASANPEVKGACAYTQDYEVNCLITTKEKCNNEYKKNPLYSQVNFSEGYLCSAQALGTRCGMSEITRCEGDDVYFVDTCGNLANVYDASKVNDQEYWAKMQSPTCSSSNPAACGNCDYDSGTMCKQKKVGELNPTYGNYICKSLDCSTYRGKYARSTDGLATASTYPKHGESWCETDADRGQDADSPGASYFKLACYNGEVSVEGCDYGGSNPRTRICQENISMKSAWCAHTNIYGDCYKQTNSTICEDQNIRDCKWVNGEEWDKMGNYYFDENNNYKLTKYEEENSSEDKILGVCLPKYKPGYTQQTSSSSTMCGITSTTCTVKLKKGIFGDASDLDNWWCDETEEGNNCSCYDDLTRTPFRENDDDGRSWADTVNNMCISVGDCGTQTNAVGTLGYFKNDVKMLNITS